MDRTARRLALLLVLLIAALGLGACGGNDESSTSTDRDASTASTAGSDAEPRADEGEVALGAVPVEDQATAMLEVKLENVGASKDAGLPPPVGIKCTKSIPATCTETIECPVADDANDPAAQQVCGWLKREGASTLVDEPDADRMCTEQYGGPEVATVAGMLDGKPVDVSFSRENGCAISRFDAASVLWLGVMPVAGGAGGGAAAGSCLALPPDTPVSSDAPAAGGAADEVCATPATPPSPPSPAEPGVINDPPEAFELEQ
jgi:hypothetical protein